MNYSYSDNSRWPPLGRTETSGSQACRFVSFILVFSYSTNICFIFLRFNLNDNILTKDPISTRDWRNGQEKDTRAGLETHLLEPVVLFFFFLLKKKCTNVHLQRRNQPPLKYLCWQWQGTGLERLFLLEPPILFPPSFNNIYLQ